MDSCSRASSALIRVGRPGARRAQDFWTTVLSPLRAGTNLLGLPPHDSDIWHTFARDIVIIACHEWTSISKERTSQTWLTGKEAVRYVHRLRAWHDAVLVGSGTVMSDDPRLTVRMVKGRNPRRIVLSGNLNIPAQARIFEDSMKDKTVVLGSD